MYTVIILNKQASDLMQDYKFLFKPFIDKGLIGLCDWNEAGTDVKTSVPDLCELIRGKRDWRAVIVNTDSLTDYSEKPKPSRVNPYDYSRFDQNPLPHESPVPLIKLTHIIGGYNLSVTKEFDEGYEYFDLEQGKLVRVRIADLTEEEIHALNEKYDDLRDAYIEREIPEEVKQLQKQMREKYAFSETRPLEIDLVSTRQQTEDNEKQLIEDSWKNHLEMRSSNFWELNKYPNNCRFLVYDMVRQDNSFYKKELSEFWLSILTLSINQIAASTLQAYRLYQMKVDVNRAELKKIINTHLNKMNAVYGFINEQLTLHPETSFDEEEDVIRRQRIPVALDRSEDKELMMTFSGVGLCNDFPTDEASEWNAQVRTKKRNLEKYWKAPRRVIDKAANRLKCKAVGFREDSYILDQFQLEDVHEYIDRAEAGIISSEVKTTLDKNAVNERIRQVDKEVKKEIRMRMNLRTVLISGALLLLICLGGYIPYLISASKLNLKVFLSALLITLAVLVVAAIGGLISLLWQRHKLVKLMKGFNGVMRDVANNMCSYGAHFETYFSDICTYMKAISILEGTKNQKGKDSSFNILLMHKRALRATIDKAKEWLISYDLERVDEIMMNVTTFFNVNLIPRENPLYFFQENYEEEDIPINSTGDMITAPYKFISKFWINREEIYDEEEE